MHLLYISIAFSIASFDTCRSTPKKTEIFVERYWVLWPSISWIILIFCRSTANYTKGFGKRKEVVLWRIEADFQSSLSLLGRGLPCQHTIYTADFHPQLASPGSWYLPASPSPSSEPKQIFGATNKSICRYWTKRDFRLYFNENLNFTMRPS